MFIQTEDTPNPATMKFLPGRTVLSQGTMDFTKIEDTASSPLAKNLFSIEGVIGVFLGSDFISITKDKNQDWQTLKPSILAKLMEAFTLNLPIITDTQNQETKAEGDIEKKIQEILDMKIRPAVAQDGGDITFDRFEEGIVFLHLRGACAGCPSASATLKAGVENMLKHYIPEVKEVRNASL